ncbi:unnamed protein product [Brachionus calyciflorus]|uniref:Chitin-binding type-2 domain-containing protein n=1 Tax=Brachionus calyciflorus TaxID=104777 RepID=A0A813MQH6_9BILA|nr:unnamed protein product [Brachionus calyciflorus]
MNSFYFFTGLIHFYQVFSIKWLGQYAQNCDLIWDDIKIYDVSNFEKCWVDCLINPACTHYTFSLSKKTCYQKRKIGITHNMAKTDSNGICGIVDRTMQCLELIEYSPEPRSCGLYYRCVNGFYNLVGCFDNLLFDPFTRQCNNYSACYHGCRNSADKVGIVLETNKYYDCQTNSIKNCTGGESFDLKEKKCLKSVQKHMFEYKKTDKFANVLLDTRKNSLDEQFAQPAIPVGNNFLRVGRETGRESQSGMSRCGGRGGNSRARGRFDQVLIQEHSQQTNKLK